VLVYILERRDRIVGKEELIENFWNDTAVTDNAVVQCIAEIRRALGDDPRGPRFIKTIPKVGYRFVATVTEELPLAKPPHVPGSLAPVTTAASRCDNIVTVGDAGARLFGHHGSAGSRGLATRAARG